MAGSIYTYKGNADPSNGTGAILTSQGRVKKGQSGLFLTSEYQDAVGLGLLVVPGPAVSPASQLTALSVAAGSAGNPNGSYKYAVTFVTGAGETVPSALTTVTLTNQQGNVSAIPVGSPLSGVTARNLYRTVAGGSQLKLLTTISDDTTTTFVDNVADGSLGANAPTTDTAGVLSTGGSTSVPTANYATTGADGYLGTPGQGGTQLSPSVVSGASLPPASGQMATSVGSSSQAIAWGNSLQPASTSAIGLTVKSLANQTGDSWQVQDSTGAVHAKMTAATSTAPASLMVGSAATLATNATSGFIGVPTVATAPTGTPSGFGSSTAIATNSSTGEIVHYTNGGWHGIGASYSVMAPFPSGDATGVTDLAALTAAEASLPTGGKLFLRNGTYQIGGGSWVWSKHMSIEGESLTTNWAGRPASTNFPASPYFYGTIIQQVTPATDVVQLGAPGLCVNLRNVGASFASAIANTNTGTPFNMTPPTWSGGPSHDIGLMGARWDNVMAANHDGNHYGFVFVNHAYNDLMHLQSFGGGGYLLTCDLTNTNLGNTTNWQPQAFVQNLGTAHGFGLSCAAVNGSTGPGVLGLIQFHRPGVQLVGAALAGGTQLPWNDRLGAGDPVNITLYDPDLETFSSHLPQPIFGQYTQIVGNAYWVNAYLGMTRFGAGAMSSNPTGQYDSAFGWQAGNALTTGQWNTFVGGLTGTLTTTGNNNTAVGTEALSSNIAGSGNTALGATALQVALGNYNVAIGSGALALYTGAACTAVGTSALGGNLSGTQNTAVGYAASITGTGSNNTALGYSANSNSTGASNNTAIGNNALHGANAGNCTAVGSNALTACTAGNNTAIGGGAAQATTTGTGITALGTSALATNISGIQCTAAGYASLNASTANDNTAFGYSAGLLITGAGNTVMGSQVLKAATTAADTVAIGYGAGSSPAGTAANATIAGNSNTFVGYQTGCNSTGDYASCVAVGYQALVGGGNAVAIGQSSVAGASNAIAIGPGASATGAGSVAIGRDSSNNAASTSTANLIAIGTVNHTTLFAGTVVTSAAALATNATTGFLYIPTCAGAPTGTPTAHTGTVPLCFDTTDSRLYVYTGGAWSDAFTA